MSNGWFNESFEHGQAAKGISLGRSKTKTSKWVNTKEQKNKSFQNIATKPTDIRSAIRFHINELKKEAAKDQPNKQSVAYHRKEIVILRAKFKAQKQRELIKKSRSFGMKKNVSQKEFNQENKEQFEEPFVW